MLKVKLAKDLRRNLMQGHPWVYRQALESLSPVSESQMCQVLDKKGDFVAWGIYSPKSPLALRILSLDKSPPKFEDFEKRFQKAFQAREVVRRTSNAYRLFNGEGDLLPGVVCDVYDQVAVLQFDGPEMSTFWNPGEIAQWLLKKANCKSVIEKPRASDNAPPNRWGEKVEGSVVTINENKALFKVNIVKGQKTGFFIDQRENRAYVREISKGKTVNNMFSYTGGFSVHAGLGQAKEVTSLDISQKALDNAEENWKLNNLPDGKHKILCADILDFFIGDAQHYDLVIVDPPSMASSEKDKEKAIRKYVDLFSGAARCVVAEGDLCLSSCSSHIQFEDFFDIIRQALSKARRRGRILRVSGQGADHPFPHACPELRYLKFVHLSLD